MHVVWPVGVRCLRRLLDGLRDVARDPSAVEAVRVLADAPVGLGEVWVRLDLVHRRRGPAGEVEVTSRGEVVEDLLVALDLPVEGLVDNEALVGDPPTGAEQGAQGAAAVALERLLPAGHGAGDADAEPAHVGLGELGRGLQARERGRLEVGRRHLAGVDRVDPVALGVVDHHEAAAADAARERLDDAEHAGCRDGGVDSVAAGAQDVDRRLRG